MAFFCSEDAGFVKRLTSRWFYWFFNRLSTLSMPPGAADFRLLDRHVVDVLLSLDERHLFLRGLTEWVGFERTYVEQAIAQAGGNLSEAARRAGISRQFLTRLAARLGVIPGSTKP